MIPCCCMLVSLMSSILDSPTHSVKSTIVVLHILPIYMWAVLGQNWLWIWSDFICKAWHCKSRDDPAKTSSVWSHERLPLSSSSLSSRLLPCNVLTVLYEAERDWQYLWASVWHHAGEADGCVKTDGRMAWVLSVWLSASLDHLSELSLSALLLNHTGWVKLQSFIKSDSRLK